MNKRAEIAKLITALGEYYDKSLSPTQIAAYTEDLLCLDPEQLTQAIVTYRNDPSNDRFPLPVKLKAVVGMAASAEDEAIMVVSRIVSAIERIGPYRVKDAREAIGEVGWQVVRLEGGWEAMCSQIPDYSTMSIKKAQWRNLCKAMASRGRVEQHLHALPSSGGSLTAIDFKKLLPKYPGGAV